MCCSFFEEYKISYIPQRIDARLVGLCTGLIAATAVASANSLTALLPLAIESVRIAFRTGAHVGKVASQLELASGRSSWSSIVNADEKTVQGALEKFEKQNVSARLLRVTCDLQQHALMRLLPDHLPFEPPLDFSSICFLRHHQRSPLNPEAILPCLGFRSTCRGHNLRSIPCIPPQHRS